MGLIINRKIQELMKGYPTISDKYDVAPAVLEGSDTVSAGQPVALGSTAGRYTAVGASTTIGQFAGFVLASNVKVPNTYPASSVDQTYIAGDAFNLMIKGFIAVPVKLGDAETISNGDQAYIMIGGVAAGAITVSGHTEASGSATAIPGAYFTGLTEAVNGETLAELCFNL